MLWNRINWDQARSLRRMRRGFAAGGTQTSDFERMKKELTTITSKADEESKNRPSLLAPEQGCPAPQKVEFESGKAIETLCAPPETAKSKKSK